MSYTKMKSWLDEELQSIRDSGIFKDEKLISAPQDDTWFHRANASG